jgi:hypothetical protein
MRYSAVACSSPDATTDLLNLWHKKREDFQYSIIVYSSNFLGSNCRALSDKRNMNDVRIEKNTSERAQ